MDRRAAWVLGIIFGGLFLCVFTFLFLFYAVVRGSSDARHTASSGNVGVIEVTGTITDSKKTLKDIKEFEADNGIKSVLVRVDSPGGAVGPSQEIYDALKRLKAKKKVVVSMGSTAASGGFYIACAGDRVFANPGTLTGSIGVIFQFPNVQGLLKWAGVGMNTITAGTRKDVGSPFRELTPDDRKYLEGVLADVHAQFIEAVAEGRHLPIAAVKAVADGRVFTGREAKELKLVDELGGFDAAVVAAGTLGGITGEPKLAYPHRDRKFLRELLSDDDMDSLYQGGAAKVVQLLGGEGLLFRSPGLAQP